MTIGNRGQETTTTIGTGTYSLAGAAAGKQTLKASAIAISGDATGPWTVHYLVADNVDWEIGEGVLTSGTPDTLTRSTVAESSNGGSAVSWGSGTRNVAIVITARDIMKPPGMVAQTTLTLATDAITPRFARHLVDTEGVASTDNLATINTTYLSDGAWLLLSAVSAARVVTVKNNSGSSPKIFTADGLDVILDSTSKKLLLERVGTTWVEIGRLGFPIPCLRSHLAGLTLSTAGSSGTFGIAAGAATDSTNTVLMEQSSAITKTTGSWSVGTGNGALDVGTIENSKMYHVFKIKRTDTGVDDALISLAPAASATATMTVASPCVVSWPNHGLLPGAPVVFSTTGALPTGITAGTTYYVISAALAVGSFEISATQGGSAINTTGTQSGVHTATSNPALPANYSAFRRIASMKTDGSAHWLAFAQDGDYFRWSSSPLDISSVNATNPGTSAVTATLTVPTGVNVMAYITQGLLSNNANVHLLVSDIAAADEAASVNNNTAATQGTNVNMVGPVLVRTNTSGQIRYRLDFSDASTNVNIRTYGWFDRRGRDY